MFRGPSTLAKDLGTIPHNSCTTCAGHLQSNCQTIPGHYKNYFQDYSNTSPKHVKHFETRLQTIAKTTLETVFTDISKLFHRRLLTHPKTVSRQFPKHFQSIPITFPKTCTAHPKKLPKLISNTLPKHLHSMSKNLFENIITKNANTKHTKHKVKCDWKNQKSELGIIHGCMTGN